MKQPNHSVGLRRNQETGESLREIQRLIDEGLQSGVSSLSRDDMLKLARGSMPSTASETSRI